MSPDPRRPGDRVRFTLTKEQARVIKVAASERARPQRPEAQDRTRTPRARPAPRRVPVRREEPIIAIVASLVALGFALVARLNDVRAFEAIATPGLYCWLALCAICTFGVLLTTQARRLGARVPWHFRASLLAGVASGLLTLGPAWKVLTKHDSAAPAPFTGARVDLRNEVVQDRSFADGDLRRADMSGATLRHVDLSGTNLSESDLRNARLEDVDLSEANLCGADLRGADLRGAHGLDVVASLAYVFYDRRTRLPRSQEDLLFTEPGPIPDTGRDLLYMCETDVTRRIPA